MPKPVADRELELWKEWKATGDDRHVEQLMSSLVPLIASQTKKWHGRLPPSTIHAKSLVLARKALDTFDPNRGVKISTHVVTQIQPVSRLVYKHQDFAYIPESRQRLAKDYKDAVEDLRDELNRQPSDAEVADRLGIGIRQVGLIRKESWRDVIDAGPMSNINPYAETSRAGEVLDFMYHDIGPTEKLVFERLVGYNGRKAMSNSMQIATETGLPVVEVDRIKRQLQRRLKEVGR